MLSGYSVFIHRIFFGSVILSVYVNIPPTESDVDGNEKDKEYLNTQFEIKTLAGQATFLGLKLVTVNME